MPRPSPDRSLGNGTIFAAGASTGGVGDVFQRVVLELRARGRAVVVADLPPRQTAITAVAAALWRSWRDLRRSDHVHLELGSNDLAAFWFALAAVLIRSDCVVVAHDYPKLINDPCLGLTGSGRLPRAVALRVLKPLIDQRLRRLLLRHAGVVVTFGEEAREGFAEMGARDTRVVCHGSDPAPPGSPDPSEGDSILFAGFMGPSKGVDVLLDAWGEIEHDVPLPLVFAGAPDEPRFSEMMERYQHLSKPPQMLGSIAAESEFQSLIARSAIVVLPYRFSAPASGILVRAMATGRAVIVTPVPAARGVVRDGQNGLIVPAGDPRALASRLITLALDPGERDRLGAAAAGTAREQFSWERQLDDLEAAYASSRSGRQA
jgi:glycosyltransferase involved in cell wall biosynthesis